MAAYAYRMLIGALATLCCISAGRLDPGQADRLGHLCVVGMVGSIDNDMCGFSSTIGADTALHRIVDACDSLITTAKSHRRTFIVEVMGRNCGYLALMAAIAVGADWVFIPEVPPQCEDWERELCETLENRQRHSKYASPGRACLGPACVSIPHQPLLPPI